MPSSCAAWSLTRIGLVAVSAHLSSIQPSSLSSLPGTNPNACLKANSNSSSSRERVRPCRLLSRQRRHSGVINVMCLLLSYHALHSRWKFPSRKRTPAHHDHGLWLSNPISSSRRISLFATFQISFFHATSLFSKSKARTFTPNIVVTFLGKPLFHPYIFLSLDNYTLVHFILLIWDFRIFLHFS